MRLWGSEEILYTQHPNKIRKGGLSKYESTEELLWTNCSFNQNSSQTTLNWFLLCMKMFSCIPIWLSMLTNSHCLSSLKWHTSVGSASNRLRGAYKHWWNDGSVIHCQKTQLQHNDLDNVLFVKSRILPFPSLLKTKCIPHWAHFSFSTITIAS